MQQYHDKWNPTGRRSSSREMTPILLINVIIVLGLIVVTLSSPSASQWIAASVQAEFVGSEAPASPPTQMAQPADAMRTIRTN